MAQGTIASAPTRPVLIPAPPQSAISILLLPEITRQLRYMALPKKSSKITEALLENLEDLIDDILAECETLADFEVQRAGVVAMLRIVELARMNQAAGFNPEKCMGAAIRLALKGINSLLDRETIDPEIRDRFKADSVMDALKGLNGMKAWHVPGMDRNMAQFW